MAKTPPTLEQRVDRLERSSRVCLEAIKKTLPGMFNRGDWIGRCLRILDGKEGDQ